MGHHCAGSRAFNTTLAGLGALQPPGLMGAIPKSGRSMLYALPVVAIEDGRGCVSFCIATNSSVMTCKSYVPHFPHP